MTTIVNSPQAPQASGDSGGMMGMIFGLIVLAVVVYLFFVFGLPAISRLQVGAPQINIPDKIDVTVNQTK